MKTVKFNEEEVELLIAIYEDELKEAEVYMDKLAQTLGKLKKQAEVAKPVAAGTGKKRGRKPKQQPQVQKSAEPTGKKRGRKKKVQAASLPEPVKVAPKKAAKKKQVRKSRKKVVTKPGLQKPVKVETPATPEVKE
jgi:hypothetical protein